MTFDLDQTPEDLRGLMCANPSVATDEDAATWLYRALLQNERNLSLHTDFEYAVASSYSLGTVLAGRTAQDLDGPNAGTDTPARGDGGGVAGFDAVASYTAAWHAQRLIQAGVVEEGNNRGPLIDKMLLFCGTPVGNPYCAAGVSYAFHLATGKPARQGGFPSSASSQAIRRWYETRGLLSTNPGDMLRWRGALFGWTQASNPDAGHIGIVLDLVVEGGVVTHIITAEFNTSSSGALVREGKGSYIKQRAVQGHFWYLNTGDTPGGAWWDR